LTGAKKVATTLFYAGSGNSLSLKVFGETPKKANSFRYVCVRFDSSRFTRENAFSQKFFRAPVAKGFLSCIFA